MASHANLWRGLIKEHGLAFDHSRQFVATLAGHIAMRALQCEGGPFVVVEQRRFPFRSIVTTAAVGASSLGKLSAVNIRVAGFAF